MTETQHQQFNTVALERFYTQAERTAFVQGCGYILNEYTQKAMTPEKIIKIVCGFLDADYKGTLSKSRRFEESQARHLSMVLIEKHHRLTLSAIGAIFNRDHSTVIHARKRIANDRQTYKAFDSVCVQIEEKINSLLKNELSLNHD